MEVVASFEIRPFSSSKVASCREFTERIRKLCCRRSNCANKDETKIFAVGQKTCQFWKGYLIRLRWKDYFWPLVWHDIWQNFRQVFSFIELPPSPPVQPTRLTDGRTNTCFLLATNFQLSLALRTDWLTISPFSSSKQSILDWWTDGSCRWSIHPC